MNKQVWLLVGSTGEYSDHQEWFVGYYTKEEDARARVEFLSAKARQLYVSEDNLITDWRSREKNVQEMRKYDPGFVCDYTGSNYNIYPLECLDA